MLPTIRIRNLLFLPALFVAFGCASTPSERRTTEPQKASSEESSRAIAEPTTTIEVLEPLYFDTDLAVLRPEASEALKRYAESILEHREWGVLSIEGHCDERGSDQYNAALGRRRAVAIERVLVEMGVPEARLATRSFGSQKPAVRGHDETAWRYNRRAELRFEDTLALVHES
jgi:peptidoglycan-associated lipoprotein